LLLGRPSAKLLSVISRVVGLATSGGIRNRLCRCWGAAGEDDGQFHRNSMWLPHTLACVIQRPIRPARSAMTPITPGRTAAC